MNLRCPASSHTANLVALSDTSIPTTSSTGSTILRPAHVTYCMRCYQSLLAQLRSLCLYRRGCSGGCQQLSEQHLQALRDVANDRAHDWWRAAYVLQTECWHSRTAYVIFSPEIRVEADYSEAEDQTLRSVLA
jgi:hypothetical protein